LTAAVFFRIVFFAIVTLGIGCCDAAAGDNASIFGIWATAKNHGHALIEPCGDAVCARVLDGDQLRANPDQTDIYNPDPAKQTRRVKGLYILQGYRGGPTLWQGGTVYDPQTGDSSSDSTLELVGPTTLKVKGCRLIFCRSELWTREKGGGDR
jgi:uncharacterized protein (DUF2147 family)